MSNITFTNPNLKPWYFTLWGLIKGFLLFFLKKCSSCVTALMWENWTLHFPINTFCILTEATGWVRRTLVQTEISQSLLNGFDMYFYTRDPLRMKPTDIFWAPPWGWHFWLWVSTTVQRISMKFDTHIHVPLRLNCKNFGDWLFLWCHHQIQISIYPILCLVYDWIPAVIRSAVFKSD